MRLETFFEKFELLADALNAVAKMRELVLELAVQGKLVRQISGEGTGQTLLDQIRAKKQLQDLDVEAEVTDFDFPIVPDGWALSRLGDVAEIVRGVTFPGSAKSKEHAHGDVACLRTASVQAEIDWDDLIFISPTHVSRTDQWVAPNDVMISMANSYALVGKVAIVRKVPKKATFGAFLAAIRPVLIEPYFLLYVLRSPRMQAAFRASSSQTTNIANISLGRMRPLPFPLPPLAEQKRIVAKVDELMALCDRLEAQQQERQARHTALARASLSRFTEAPTPANLNFLFHDAYTIDPADLRKSILTLAVQGKLIKHSTEAPKWPTVRMKDICEQITDGEHATPQRTSNGVPLATAKNVRDGFLDLTKTDFVSQSTAEKCWKRCKPRDQDILMVCVGATTGRVCLAQNPPDIVLVRSVALIRPNTKQMAPFFLDLFLRSPAGQTQIWGNVKQSAQPCLYLGKMAEFEISLPPLAEQRRIVAKVDQLLALVDQLETQLGKSRAAAANLLDAVVTELTAQN